MQIQQLSVFLENKPGRLGAACRALAGAGIDILTLALADTGEYGILRLIVRDWERAREVLKEAGCVVHASGAAAVAVPDRPGGLAGLLEAVEDLGINLEYMYPFTYRGRGEAILLLRFDDMDRAIAELQKAGVALLGREELFARLAEAR